MPVRVVLVGAGSVSFTRGLVADGSVASRGLASRLADDLLAAYAEHLPQF